MFIWRKSGVAEQISLLNLKATGSAGSLQARDRQWTHCKEIGDMVSKGSIVRMLLQCHDLDCVVTQLSDSGQHGHPEIQVAVHTRLLTRHTNMAFVDTQRSWPVPVPPQQLLQPDIVL